MTIFQGWVDISDALNVLTPPSDLLLAIYGILHCVQRPIVSPLCSQSPQYHMSEVADKHVPCKYYPRVRRCRYFMSIDKTEEKKLFIFVMANSFTKLTYIVH